MSIPSELGHLAVPINSSGKTRWHKRDSNPGPLDPEPYAMLLRHTGSADEFGLKKKPTWLRTVWEMRGKRVFAARTNGSNVRGLPTHGESNRLHIVLLRVKISPVDGTVHVMVKAWTS